MITLNSTTAEGQSTSSNTMLYVIGALGLGVAAWYFLIHKPKKEAELATR